MSRKLIKWIDIHSRLPERYTRVLTLLWKNSGYDMCMNSIQCRNIQHADGSLSEVYQWGKENLRVAYWLDGLPKLPEDPPQETKDEV